MTAGSHALDGQPDVQLRGVSKSFGDVVAVADLSLEIRRGEFFSLLGSSGCGKSTTLRMIGGLERATRGDLFIRGERVNDVPAHRRATNMVFQHLGLFPHLTVFDNIAFGLRLKRLDRATIAARVREYLGLVSLSGYENRFPDQLSGGQQQRVAIARALVNEPAVLLLDEPLGALDLKLRMQMQQELKSLQCRLRATFIYVTHDQGEAFAMSDRIAVMNGGRLEQIGTPKEIYQRPANQFVTSFVGETNLLEAKIEGRETSGALILAVQGLKTAGSPASAATSGKVLLSIRPEHVEISTGPDARKLPAPATVKSVVFQGSLVHIAMETTEGTEISSKVFQGSPASGLKRGDQVYIGWQPDNATVLP